MPYLSAIVAIINLIPQLKAGFEALMAYYVQTQIASIKKEYSDAIRKAIDEHDQRDLERAIGSPRAGLPSGLNGTHIVDSIPGVPAEPKP